MTLVATPIAKLGSWWQIATVTDGRVTTDPDKLEAAILLIEGGSSENAACKEVGIARSTFRQAVVRVGAGVNYARACEALAVDQVDKLEQVVTDLREGVITADVARVEADIRKWTASKLFKPQWGDRTVIAGDKDAPLAVADVTDLERAKAVAALVAAAQRGEK